MKIFIFFCAFTCLQIVNSGYVYNRGLGNDCLYDEDCITKNSFCRGNKICACKIGYQYDAGSDVCFPREVDLKCLEDYDCSALQNAKCLNRVCKCKNDYVASNDKSFCLPSLKLTSYCEEDTQCNSVMNKSYCDQIIKQCVCERGYTKDTFRMQCIEKASLHSPCLSTEDCEVNKELQGKVECRYVGRMLSTCECKNSFIEINDNCYEGYYNSSSALSVSTFVILILATLLSRNY